MADSGPKPQPRSRPAQAPRTGGPGGARGRARAARPKPSAPGTAPRLAARPGERPPDLSAQLPHVLAVGEKYGYDAAHATHVAALASELFRALGHIHDLEPEWEIPLRHAALLHDIGYFVHARRHHRHSRYLILTDALLDDYPDPWRAVMALIARNHRRRAVAAPRRWGPRRRPAAMLAAILRIADGLDYGHDAAASLHLVRLRRGGLEIAVSGLRLHAIEPVLRKKSALFTKVFALPVTFVAAVEG